MNKRFSFAILILLFALSFSSCKRNTLKGEGNKTTTNPTVASFNAVDIDVPLKITVNVQPGAQPGIQLSGYENVIKHITVRIEDNTLVISTDLDDTWNINGDGVTAIITTPSLQALGLSGSPDADVHGNITGSAFDIDVSGASTVKMDSVNADTFAIQLSGAGTFIINGGSVKYAEYEISGAGNVKAFALQTGETVASISGTGSSEVTATQKLAASISGAGSIKYKGHPAITQEVSGVGAVKDAN